MMKKWISPTGPRCPNAGRQVVPAVSLLSCFPILLMACLLSGCVGINAIHHQARAGDTVFLALGSPTGMSRNNVTAIYRPSDGSDDIDLTGNIRAVFRLFPEKTSPVYLNNTNTAFSWNHEPWLVTMAIDLPHPLPVGPGVVKVTCVPESSCTYPSYHPHVKDVDIGLEILPGIGEPHPLAYMGGFGVANTLDPVDLEGVQQVVLTPSLNTQVSSNTRFGAAKISINMPVGTTSGAPVADEVIKVIPSDLTVGTNSQRQFSWARKGDVLTLFIVSPSGMTYIESTLSIVLHVPNNSMQAGFLSPPAIVASAYYDTNGQQVNGPTLDVVLK